MFPSTQLQALSDLYYATNGSDWGYNDCTRIRWNFSEVNVNPCTAQWCGLECNTDNTTIIQLSLQGYRLRGTIPPSINQLVDLHDLNLNFNSLSGTIPSSLKSFTKLVTLSLAQNVIKGTIPDIFTNQSMLESIFLYANDLEGRIPASFQKLTKIKTIYFSGNRLYGQLLDWLTPKQLQQLITFSISQNYFSGFFPSVTNLTSVGVFDIQKNNFIGSLPDIFYHNKLLTFSMSNNHFSGSLPVSLTQSPSLIYLIADNNLLTGRIDNIDWTTLPALYELSLLGNLISGRFPESLCSLAPVEAINLGFNLLTGSLSIPKCQRTLYPTIGVFTVQGNFFTGSLQDIFDSQQTHIFGALALSNNEFTGTLSGEFFLNTRYLRTFAVGSNCLSGTIPKEVCQLSILEAFSVDGASAADNCRFPLVNIPSIGLNAFITRKALTGTIPACLFELDLISSLSLSGNQFSGTLPSVSFENSTHLLDISLSHNQLSGTIPLSWYERDWLLFDLSYNKLTGTLPESSVIKLKKGYSTVALNVNRLSGSIPSTLTSFNTSLTLLQGNMFSCSLNKQEVPTIDPYYDTYLCGSNIVNTSIYLWLFVLFLLVSCLVMFRKCFQRILKTNEMTTNRLISFSKEEGDEREFEETHEKTLFQQLSRFYTIIFLDNSLNHPIALKDSSIYEFTDKFFAYTLHVRRFAIILCSFIFVVLLPVYAALGVYYRTYSERYAWTISATFLSGTNAMITLMIFFIIVMVMTIVFLHKLFKNPVIDHYSHSSCSCIQKGFNWREIALWTTAWVVNGIIMITADSLYVYTIVNRSVKYDYLIQILLALFKLAWHDIGMFRMIHWLKQYFHVNSPSSSHQQSPSLSIDSGIMSSGRVTLPMMLTFPLTSEEGENDDLSLLNDLRQSYIRLVFFGESLLTVRDIRYLTYMSIVNKVIIPCIAIFFISSSCFYNALVSQSPQAAIFSFCYLTVATAQTCVNVLGSSLNDNTSYTPPFSYSYQCSSAFLTDYVSVYVFMFLWSSVLLPVLTLALTRLYDFLQKRQEKGHEVNQLLFKVVKSLLPLGWDEETLTEETQRKMKTLTIHRKQLLTLRISYSLAVLFVFGTLFPPIALITTIAVINITLLEEYLTKRMSVTHQRDQEKFMFYLEEECKDIDKNFFKVMRLIVCVTCVLMGFLLFDVFGDRYGWSYGLIPMMLMMSMPLLLSILDVYNRRKSSSRNSMNSCRIW